MPEMRMTMKQFGLVVAMVVLLVPAASSAPVPGPWDQPAAGLAARIADILGPGPARLTIRNLSSIPNSAIPAIRSLLVQDLEQRGVVDSGAESATAVLITLSESAHNRLWVAQVAEGDQTQVTMVRLAPDQPHPSLAAGGLLLRSELVIAVPEPVVAALPVADDLAVLEPEALVIYARGGTGWQELKRVSLEGQIPLARDPRGLLMPAASGTGFTAWLPGGRCTGSLAGAGTQASWSLACAASDDPWTVLGPPSVSPALTPALQPAQTGVATPVGIAPAAFKAFYNVARDYFTGVVSPSLGVDLPAFYSAALIPRAAGDGALLLNGVDGTVRLAENGKLEAVAGARDWGSDLAVLRSGCGAGTQIVASGSGEAVSDSLRAYELPALEAVPASAPLATDGTVTALWSAPDFASIYAAVRTPANQYEVERVSALCN
jgi:hypothetical protein